MGRKCCVFGCKSGYDTYIKKNGQKFPLYKFPQDEHQRKLWTRAIPNVLGKILPNHRVCGRHFVNVRMTKSNRNGSFNSSRTTKLFW